MGIPVPAHLSTLSYSLNKCKGSSHDLESRAIALAATYQRELRLQY